MTIEGRSSPPTSIHQQESGPPLGGPAKSEDQQPVAAVGHISLEKMQHLPEKRTKTGAQHGGTPV